MSGGRSALTENGSITPPSEAEAVTVPPTFQLELVSNWPVSSGPITITAKEPFLGYENEMLFAPDQPGCRLNVPPSR